VRESLGCLNVRLGGRRPDEEASPARTCAAWSEIELMTSDRKLKASREGSKCQRECAVRESLGCLNVWRGGSSPEENEAENSPARKCASWSENELLYRGRGTPTGGFGYEEEEEDNSPASALRGQQARAPHQQTLPCKFF